VPGGSVAVRRRIVAIEADLGDGRSPRWRYGSGLLIGGRRVLTAAHVVSGAVAVSVRRLGGVVWATLLDNALIGDPDRLDLALLDVPEAEDLVSVRVAAVNRNVAGGEFVERCWAVGFPLFQEVQRDKAGRSQRETAHVRGEIPPLSGLAEHLLSLQVTASPRPLPPEGDTAGSEWSGMSGAAVFAGDLLVGVVTEHSRWRGPSDVTVTPLARLTEPENAPADAAEWWSRLGVADPIDLPLIPLATSRNEPAYRATLRVIRQRTPILLGRDGELASIAAFATGSGDVFGPGTGSTGYLWLIGRAWAGKTAVLAEAVCAVPPEVDVVAYFLVARDADASRAQFLAAVVPQLAWLLDQDSPPSADLAVFRDLWARAAARAETFGRHLLLVVDGLDEDLRPGGPSVAAALPTEHLGPYARVLVASRPYPELPDDVIHHPLRSALQVPLAESPHASEISLLARQEIRGLLKPEATAASDLAFEVMGLLTAAAGPLSVGDLAAMIDNSNVRTVRAFVEDRAARSLETIGSGDRRRYRFAHETLLEFCRQHPDVGGDQQYRARLSAWADEWQTKKWPVSEEASADTPLYLLDSYPATLARDHKDQVRQLPDRQRIATLLSDIGWLDTAVLRIGVDQVLATVHTAVQLAPTDTVLASMLRLLQLQAHHLRYAHLQGRPGLAAVQLAWEAIRAGLPDQVRPASDRIQQCPPPQMIPTWTTEHTSHNLMRPVGTLDGEVTAVAVTGQGKIVSASSGYDGVIRLWDPDVPGDPGRDLGHHPGNIGAVAVTGQGKVVSGDHFEGILRLWDPDVANDRGRKLGRHAGGVDAVAVTGQGKIVSAGGGYDGVIRLWDPDVRRDRGRVLGRCLGGVHAVAVTRQGKVVSGGVDGVIRLWDPDIPDDPGRVLGHHDDQVTAIAVTGQNKVVSGDYRGKLRLWDPDLADDPGRDLGEIGGGIGSMVLAVTGRGKVVSGRGRVLMLWDPDVPGDPGRDLGHHASGVTAVAVTGQGRVVSGGVDGVIRLWDADIPDDPTQEQNGHVGTAWAVAVTSQGKVVSGDFDGVVRLWDPDVPDDPGRALGHHQSAVTAVAVTRQGKVVSGDFDGVVRLWDPDLADDPGRVLGHHVGTVQAITVTGQDKVISGGSGYDGWMRLWDPDLADDPGRMLGRYHSSGVYAVAVTSQGKVVSGDLHGVVRLWDPDVADDPGRILGRHTLGVYAVAVTGHGKVVSGGGDGMVRLWDPDVPDDPGRDLGRHDGTVRAVAVTSQGKVISGGADGVVRLWDPDLADHPGWVLGSHDGDTFSLAVTLGGEAIIIASRGVTLLRLNLV
jgi:WD40 repeat protein